MIELPQALSFLKGYFEDPSVSYRSANWLLSNFDEEIWLYSFDFAEPASIDWRIKLDDESSLTDTKNLGLLKAFKHYLISSTRAENGLGNDVGSVTTLQISFNRCTHIIDHILLNQSEYHISEFGLAGINANHLIAILTQVTSSKSTAESVYEWTLRAANYCHHLLKEIPATQIDDILRTHPDMMILNPDLLEYANFPLKGDMLVRARAALFIKGLYRAKGSNMHVNTTSLSGIIYKSTLKGKLQAKPRLLALQYGEDTNNFFREFPGVGVTSETDQTMTGPAKHLYRMSIYGLGILREIGIPAPSTHDLNELLTAQVEGRKPGRFRTLPSRIAFSVFRKAVEFHLEFGNILTTGFCNIVKYCKEKNLTLNQITGDQFNEAAGSELLHIGTSKIGLSCKIKGVHKAIGPRKVDLDEYFHELRENHPLLELLAVYIGSVQIVTGAIMARRSGEMQDLHTLTCLDESRSWLIFKNRKSTKNLYGIRNTEARPIEPIAIEMIETLINMQSQLVELGHIPKMTYLFSTPSLQGAPKLIDPDAYTYNRNIDLACDYFQTETNKYGQRHYIRQHQLRRFFAMLIFYSSSFGGLDVLRWMLAHTDLKHVWHYITEAMDGATLLSAKAQFVAESLHANGTAEYKDLAALLKSRYGTDNFALVDTDELETEIQELMKSGEVLIEPEFLDNYDNQRMKAIVKVSPIQA